MKLTEIVATRASSNFVLIYIMDGKRKMKPGMMMDEIKDFVRKEEIIIDDYAVCQGEIVKEFG